MYLILLFFIILYALFLDKPKGLISRLFLSTVIFFGVNTLYFFFSYIFTLSLNLNILFCIHLFYSIIWFFLIKKDFLKRPRNELLVINITDLMLIFITLITCMTFYQSIVSFDNGVRLPVFSFTQDAANHIIFTKEIFDSNKLETIYPLGFHANAWLFEVITTNIIGNNNYDQIVFINVFSVFTIFTMVLLTGLFYLIVDSLIISSTKEQKIVLKFLLAMLVVFFGMIIPYYLLADGFYSTWFNQIFLFSLILFFISGFEKRKDFLYIFLPLGIGFIYSYIFFIPALLIFLFILILINKNKQNLFLFLIVFVSSLLIVWKFFQIEEKALYLANASGAFVDYTPIIVAVYVLPTVIYLYYFHIKNFKKDSILMYMSLSFVIFSLLLAVYQLVTTGFLQYSFYKTFSVVIIIFAIFSITGIYKILENIYEKLDFSKLTLYFGLLATAFFFWKFFPQLSTYNHQMFSLGRYNFLENNKEKYNTISYVIENMGNFDKYIYIDSNFSSSQWGNKLLRISGLNSINKNNDNGINESIGKMEKYVELLGDLKKDEKILIIDPVRYLEVNCNAEEFVIKSVNSGKNIVFYPYFDLNVWNKNCKSVSK